MDENLKEVLKDYITRRELEEMLTRQRTASEQFLEDHDRNFRLMEKQMSDTQRQVSDAVVNLNAGLSKLNVLSDALSNIMRVMNDNYEAIRTVQRSLEERVSKVEQAQGVQGEEFRNFYGVIFGDASRPDQESMMAMLRKRYEKADAHHEATMLRFDMIEERQDKIEEQIEKWQRWFAVVFQGFGNGVKSAIPRIGKWAGGMFVAFVVARLSAPQFMNQIGTLIKWLLGIP